MSPRSRATWPPSVSRYLADGTGEPRALRSIYADWERGDHSSAEWAHPDIEYVVVGGPEPGSWTGLAGMAASHREVLGAFADFRIEADEYKQLDDERVLTSKP